jgi:hypothetical protein
MNGTTASIGGGSKGRKCIQMSFDNNKKVKVKLSHYMPWRRLGGEKI